MRIIHLLWFCILIYCLEAQSDTHVTVSFSANDVIPTSEAQVFVNNSTRVVITCSIQTAARAWTMYVKNETNETLVAASTTHVLEYNIESADCQHSGTYRCVIQDRDNKLLNESVIYLWVTPCPVKLCHNSPRTLTSRPPIGSSTLLSLCVLADKRNFNFYGLKLNEVTLYNFGGKGKYDFYFTSLSPIHFMYHLEIKNIQPSDYKTYEIIIVIMLFGRLEFNYTFSIIGERCPPGWCEIPEEFCVHLEGPSDNVTVARHQCKLYDGHLVEQELLGSRSKCLTDLAPRSSVFAAEKNNLCKVWLSGTMTWNLTDCDHLSKFYYFCQIPFWAKWPPEGLKSKISNSTSLRRTKEINNSSLHVKKSSLIIGVVASIVGLIIIITVSAYIRRSALRSGKKEQESSMLNGTNLELHGTVASSQENQYETIDNMRNEQRDLYSTKLDNLFVNSPLTETIVSLNNDYILPFHVDYSNTNITMVKHLKSNLKFDQGKPYKDELMNIFTTPVHPIHNESIQPKDCYSCEPMPQCTYLGSTDVLECNGKEANEMIKDEVQKQSVPFNMNGDHLETLTMEVLNDEISTTYSHKEQSTRVKELVNGTSCYETLVIESEMLNADSFSNKLVKESECESHNADSFSHILVKESERESHNVDRFSHTLMKEIERESHNADRFSHTLMKERECGSTSANICSDTLVKENGDTNIYMSYTRMDEVDAVNDYYSYALIKDLGKMDQHSCESNAAEVILDSKSDCLSSVVEPETDGTRVESDVYGLINEHNVCVGTTATNVDMHDSSMITLSQTLVKEQGTNCHSHSSVFIPDLHINSYSNTITKEADTLTNSYSETCMKETETDTSSHSDTNMKETETDTSSHSDTNIKETETDTSSHSDTNTKETATYISSHSNKNIKETETDTSSHSDTNMKN